jgi:hypothetical protein
LNEQRTAFLVKLNVILAIAVLSIIVIFPIARRIQKIRVSSLALYAELKKDDVKDII